NNLLLTVNPLSETLATTFDYPVKLLFGILPCSLYPNSVQVVTRTSQVVLDAPTPSVDRVKELIDGGNVPVITVVENIGQDGIPVVTLEAHKSSEKPYFAISHVWADGLGSSTEKGLPVCQLRKLSARVRKCQTEMDAFWTDALCIPESDRETRKRAITMMAKTYQEA
ncbi:hypothetical protein QBC38DRAFT_461991, partial [Podospora fimiseda]